MNITAANVTLEYEVMDLHIFTAYKVQVKAYTAVGAGKEATVHVTTSEDSKIFILYMVYIF